jgi:signal transduction histidine kinase
MGKTSVVFKSKLFWKFYLSFFVIVLFLLMGIWIILRDQLHIKAVFFDFLILSGFAIFLSLTWGYLVSWKISHAISQMLASCHSIGKGNYNALVTTFPNDEIGDLGRTINQLAEEIKSKIFLISEERTHFNEVLTQLREAETIRNDFIENISHELKTPLTSIRGYAETLLEGAINDPKFNIRFLKKIETNAQRLSDLVSDILALAYIESVKTKFNLMPLSWKSIVEKINLRFEEILKQKSITLTFNYPDAPAKVLGEMEAMEQIYENLLSNAIRYSEPFGQIHVQILPKDLGYVALLVTDTGIGIDKEHQERIFERFYRVDRDRSRALGGTGLGLAIVKHLVQKLGGQLNLTSKLGQGTTFFISLKAAPKKTDLTSI